MRLLRVELEAMGVEAHEVSVRQVADHLHEITFNWGYFGETPRPRTLLFFSRTRLDDREHVPELLEVQLTNQVDLLFFKAKGGITTWRRSSDLQQRLIGSLRIGGFVVSDDLAGLAWVDQSDQFQELEVGDELRSFRWPSYGYDAVHLFQKLPAAAGDSRTSLEGRELDSASDPEASLDGSTMTDDAASDLHHGFEAKHSAEPEGGREEADNTGEETERIDPSQISLFEEALHTAWIKGEVFPQEMSPMARSVATTGPHHVVAVIGAGPAGFGAAEALVKQGHRVVLLNQDIRPGGLAEYGIYVDKDLQMKEPYRQKVFTRMLEDPRVVYLGHVTVGEGDEADVSLEDLRRMGFGAIVVATGAQGSKRLGIPGEGAQGVYDAKELVYYYNGQPALRRRAPSLGPRVAVIGMGNVVVDVTDWMVHRTEYAAVERFASALPAEALGRLVERLQEASFEDLAHRLRMASPPVGRAIRLDELRDMLTAIGRGDLLPRLREASKRAEAGRTRVIYWVARRGPNEKAFEPAELEQVAAYVDLEDLRAELRRIQPAMRWSDEERDRALLELLFQHPKTKRMPDPAGVPARLARFGTRLDTARVRMRFLLSPVEIGADAKGRVREVLLEANTLVDADGRRSAVGTGATTALEVDSLIRSIGNVADAQLGLPLSGDLYSVNATPQEGTAAPAAEPFEVIDPQTGRALPGIFVAGWARKPSEGKVGVAMKDGRDAAMTAVAPYLAAQAPPALATASPIEALRQTLEQRGVRVVSAADVERLYQLQAQQGTRFNDDEEMLTLLSQGAGATPRAAIPIAPSDEEQSPRYADQPRPGTLAFYRQAGDTGLGAERVHEHADAPGASSPSSGSDPKRGRGSDPSHAPGAGGMGQTGQRSGQSSTRERTEILDITEEMRDRLRAVLPTRLHEPAQPGFVPDRTMKRVLQMLLEGRSNAEMAGRLRMSESQLDWLLYHQLFPALGVESRRDAALLAVVVGWVTEVRAPARPASRRSPLTRAQEEVLIGLAQGQSHQQLARQFRGTRNLVKGRLRNVYQRRGFPARWRDEYEALVILLAIGKPSDVEVLWDGLLREESPREIGERLGVSQKAVSKLLSRHVYRPLDVSAPAEAVYAGLMRGGIPLDVNAPPAWIAKPWLTEGQWEIFGALATGSGYGEIALRLGKREPLVGSVAHNIAKRLNEHGVPVRDIQIAAVKMWYVQNRMLSLEDRQFLVGAVDEGFPVRLIPAGREADRRKERRISARSGAYSVIITRLDAEHEVAEVPIYFGSGETVDEVRITVARIATRRTEGLAHRALEVVIEPSTPGGDIAPWTQRAVARAVLREVTRSYQEQAQQERREVHFYTQEDHTRLPAEGPPSGRVHISPGALGLEQEPPHYAPNPTENPPGVDFGALGMNAPAHHASDAPGAEGAGGAGEAHEEQARARVDALNRQLEALLARERRPKNRNPSALVPMALDNFKDILRELLRAYGSIGAMRGLRALELGPTGEMLTLLEFLRSRGVEIEGIGRDLYGFKEEYLHRVDDYNDYLAHVAPDSLDFVVARLSLYPDIDAVGKTRGAMMRERYGPLAQALKPGGFIITMTYHSEGQMAPDDGELKAVGLRELHRVYVTLPTMWQATVYVFQKPDAAGGSEDEDISVDAARLSQSGEVFPQEPSPRKGRLEKTPQEYLNIFARYLDVVGQPSPQGLFVVGEPLFDREVIAKLVFLGGNPQALAELRSLLRLTPSGETRASVDSVRDAIRRLAAALKNSGGFEPFDLRFQRADQPRPGTPDFDPNAPTEWGDGWRRFQYAEGSAGERAQEPPDAPGAEDGEVPGGSQGAEPSPISEPKSDSEILKEVIFAFRDAIQLKTAEGFISHPHEYRCGIELIDRAYRRRQQDENLKRIAKLKEMGVIDDHQKKRMQGLINLLFEFKFIFDDWPFIEEFTDKEAEELCWQIVKLVLKDAHSADWQDPLRKLKRRANRALIRQLREMEEIISSPKDNFFGRIINSIKIAITGNSLGFAEFSSLSKKGRDLSLALEEALGKGLDADDTKELMAGLNKAIRLNILYFLDNAGEFIYDLPLIKILLESGNHLIIVAKESSIANDMTVRDVGEILRRKKIQEYFFTKDGRNLLENTAVISSGTAVMGLDPRRASRELLEGWKKANIIILKGEGYWQTLKYWDLTRDVFFLLAVKQAERVRGEAKKGQRLLRYKRRGIEYSSPTLERLGFDLGESLEREILALRLRLFGRKKEEIVKVVITRIGRETINLGIDIAEHVQRELAKGVSEEIMGRLPHYELVAIVDEAGKRKIIGFAKLAETVQHTSRGINRYFGPNYYFVEPHYRGQGIGKMLMQAIEAVALRRNSRIAKITGRFDESRPVIPDVFRIHIKSGLFTGKPSLSSGAQAYEQLREMGYRFNRIHKMRKVNSGVFGIELSLDLEMQRNFYLPEKSPLNISLLRERINHNFIAISQIALLIYAHYLSEIAWHPEYPVGTALKIQRITPQMLELLNAFYHPAKLEMETKKHFYEPEEVFLEMFKSHFYLAMGFTSDHMFLDAIAWVDKDLADRLKEARVLEAGFGPGTPHILQGPDENPHREVLIKLGRPDSLGRETLRMVFGKDAAGFNEAVMLIAENEKLFFSVFNELKLEDSLGIETLRTAFVKDPFVFVEAVMGIAEEREFLLSVFNELKSPGLLGIEALSSGFGKDTIGVVRAIKVIAENKELFNKLRLPDSLGIGTLRAVLKDNPWGFAYAVGEIADNRDLFDELTSPDSLGIDILRLGFRNDPFGFAEAIQVIAENRDLFHKLSSPESLGRETLRVAFGNGPEIFADAFKIIVKLNLAQYTPESIFKALGKEIEIRQRLSEIAESEGIHFQGRIEIPEFYCLALVCYSRPEYIERFLQDGRLVRAIHPLAVACVRLFGRGDSYRFMPAQRVKIIPDVPQISALPEIKVSDLGKVVGPFGRAVIFGSPEGKFVLVTKFLKIGEDIAEFAQEPKFFSELRAMPIGKRNYFPEPIAQNGSFLVRVRKDTLQGIEGLDVESLYSEEGYYVAFRYKLDHLSYFTYLEYLGDRKEFDQAIERNIRELAELIRDYGIAHAELIPLFHDSARDIRYSLNNLPAGCVDNISAAVRFSNLRLSGIADLSGRHLIFASPSGFGVFLMMDIARTQLFQAVLLAADVYQRHAWSKKEFSALLKRTFNAYYHELLEKNLPEGLIDWHQLAGHILRGFAKKQQGIDLGYDNSPLSIYGLVRAVDFAGLQILIDILRQNSTPLDRR